LIYQVDHINSGILKNVSIIENGVAKDNISAGLIITVGIVELINPPPVIPKIKDRIIRFWNGTKWVIKPN
jgi:hypothetical protein